MRSFMLHLADRAVHRWAPRPLPSWAQRICDAYEEDLTKDDKPDAG